MKKRNSISIDILPFIYFQIFFYRYHNIPSSLCLLPFFFFFFFFLFLFFFFFFFFSLYVSLFFFSSQNTNPACPACRKDFQSSPDPFLLSALLPVFPSNVLIAIWAQEILS